MSHTSEISVLRRSTAILLSVLLLALAFAVVAMPWIKPDKLGIAAALVFLALLAVGRGALWHRPRRWIWALVAAALVSLPFVVIAHGFGSVDMMAFLFHLEFGVEGAGLEELHNEILTGVLALGWFVFAAYALSRLLGRRVLPYVAAVGLLLVSHPMVIYAATAVRAGTVDSDLAERLVQAPDWNGTAPEADLVLVYLEGLDAVYFDPEYYGDALAPLEALRAEGLSLGAVRQIEATGWSMAGIVASQCGVPLVPNGFRARNNFHGVEDYLGQHRCLGDVMKEAGYRLEFLQGGDLGFAGYGTFLRQHGFDAPIGVAHFRERYPEELVRKAHIDWIVDDQLLFAETLARQRELLKGDAPYGLFVQTITTHGDIAYASRTCMLDGQAGQTRDVPRVLKCFGDQVAGLVAELRAQAGDRPMRIVLMSDHLSHDPRFKRDLPLETRENTVILIDETGARTGSLTKEGSMIDVYPTLLDWLELAPEGGTTRAGLGVSLFSDAPTLVAEKGLGALNDELYINPELGRAIWREGPQGGR